MDETDLEILLNRVRQSPGMLGRALVAEVSCKKSFDWPQEKSEKVLPHIVAYDFGIKYNILRSLAARGFRITIVPAETPAATVGAKVLPEAGDGYQLTAHVLRYYETAKV